MPAYGLRFDVNCSILFTELPLLERPAAAAAAGFSAVELWWPFAGPTPSRADADALRRALTDAGVRLVGLNFDAGDMAAGDRGLASRPDDSARFRAGIKPAVDLAEATGCRALNALYGNRVPGVDPRVQDDLAVENVTLAAKAAAGIGAVVLVEALNSHDSPDYPLVSSASALAFIDRVRREGGVDNVAFLADVYHLARMDEDLPGVLSEHAADIGHVQIADAPGRGQPGTGMIDFDTLFDVLRARGYGGWVGCEYKPAGASVESFDWLPRPDRTAPVGP